jgi:hypothetical protein
MVNPKRFQFSLRTLMAVTTLCAVGLALLTTLGMDVLLAFCGLIFSCGFVLLLALALVPVDRLVARMPYLVSLILTPVLYCALAFAFFLFGEAIDQPHPEYAEGNWVTHGVLQFLKFAPLIAAVMLVLVVLDASAQISRPKDRVYYPQIVRLCHGIHSLSVRLVLIVGISIVVGYYGDTVIAVWSAEQVASGCVWPPKRVFVACHLLWGLLWLLDCTSRPYGGTIGAAIGFLCIALFLLMPALGFGVLRE